VPDRQSDRVYQAASRPAPPSVDTVRVVLVLDVPARSAGLPRRTAELADEFGRLIVQSLPGVRAHKAVVAAGPAGTLPRSCVAASPLAGEEEQQQPQARVPQLFCWAPELL